MRIRGLFLFRRYSLPILIVLLLLFALVLMSLRTKQRKGVELFDALLMEISFPFQKAATLVIKTVQGTFLHYVFLVNLERENRMLKEKIAQLQEENHRMNEIKLANERLRQLLQFREKNSTSMIGAEVIGRDPSSWFRSVTIDKGERDGVKKGMAVISPTGVIGQILKIAPHYATVLLITDYNSAVDCVVVRSRAKAIVEGIGENRCQLKYLLRAEDVAVGDVLVTSGLGGNFPKGLMVGEVKKVDKKGYGVFQFAELVPSVDMTRLEEVFVVMEQELLPPSHPQKEKEKKRKKTKK
jgi:rod shape-determining protein MreC